MPSEDSRRFRQLPEEEKKTKEERAHLFLIYFHARNERACQMLLLRHQQQQYICQGFFWPSRFFSLGYIIMAQAIEI